MSEKLLWWAYRHTNGEIHLKRYFSSQDIEEASESPFVADYTGCFPANNREEALPLAESLLK